MVKRKNLSKKTRFEVFKRDSFTCQYCGKSAPDVVLEVDHIEPVSKGGTNEITNLVTSCFDCNRGKSDRKISDDAVVKKQMNELETLNARREQIEMVFQWKKELANQDNEIIDEVIKIVNEDYLSPGRSINEFGRDKIKKVYKKYGFQSLLNALDETFDSYPDPEKALDKLERVAYHIEHPMPEKVRQSFYLRGILKNRLNYVDDGYALQLLQKDLNLRTFEDVKDFCLEVKNWTEFRNRSEYTIEQEASQSENS